MKLVLFKTMTLNDGLNISACSWCWKLSERRGNACAWIIRYKPQNIHYKTGYQYNEKIYPLLIIFAGFIMKWNQWSAEGKVYYI